MELVELKPILPDDMNLLIKGKAKANMLTDFALNDMQNLDLQKMNLNGDFVIHDMEAVYNDSLFIQSPEAKLKITSFTKAKRKASDKLFDIEIKSKDMDQND